MKIKILALKDQMNIEEAEQLEDMFRAVEDVSEDEEFSFSHSNDGEEGE